VSNVFILTLQNYTRFTRQHWTLNRNNEIKRSPVA